MTGTERASLITAVLSLLIAIIATVLAYMAWQRPLPADPRSIPALGDFDDPVVIDGGNGGREFFAFLDAHEGRKVRITATVDESAVKLLKVEGQMQADGFDIPGLEDEANGVSASLIINGIREGAPRITYTSGTWSISGYFASYGVVAARMGTVERSITPIDIITAVS